MCSVWRVFSISILANKGEGGGWSTIALLPPLIFSRRHHPEGATSYCWMAGDHTHIFAETIIVVLCDDNVRQLWL
jgi:hypothetical protein